MRHLGLSKNMDYRNTRNMIVSLPSSFFGLVFTNYSSENPPTPVFQQDSDDDPQPTFWGNPYFQTNPAAEAKFGRPVIYPRAPQDVAATSCLTRLSKDPMANSPWVGQFAEAFLLEKRRWAFRACRFWLFGVFVQLLVQITHVPYVYHTF